MATFMRFVRDNPVGFYQKMKSCAERFYRNKANLFQMPDQFAPTEADYN